MEERPKYARAPLMSAVIEFRLQEALPENELRKLGERFQPMKWNKEEVLEFEFRFGTTEPPTSRLSGYRFVSPDADQIIQVDRSNYSLSVLPPYPGWQTLVESFKTHLVTWRKVVGRRLLGRIGVRYVNRFDIPARDGLMSTQGYLTFGPQNVSAFDMPVRGASAQLSSGVAADNLLVNLAMALVDTPLIAHVGLSLDIDLYREGVDVPQESSDILALLEVVRRRRTEIFETCITDEMRKLIS